MVWPHFDGIHFWPDTPTGDRCPDKIHSLPPANEVWGKVIFLHLFVILFTGGVRGCWGGGCAWFGGGRHVAAGGHAWLGGHVWLPGACVVAGGCMVAGGMHGCWGACMVAGGCVVAGGHAWFQVSMRGSRGACVVLGGMCGCWGACMVARGACIGYDEIRSMSGRYAFYWNAFLLLNTVTNIARPLPYPRKNGVMFKALL